MNDEIQPIEAGEFQLRKAFEQTTSQNVKTVIDYSTQTRELTRAVEKEVKEIKLLVLQQREEILKLKTQLSLIQAKLYKNGF